MLAIKRGDGDTAAAYRTPESLSKMHKSQEKFGAVMHSYANFISQQKAIKSIENTHRSYMEALTHCIYYLIKLVDIHICE